MTVGSATGRTWLMPGVRPVPGRIRTEPEDFRVEEIPAYLPVGTGRHVFFRIRKRGLPTLEAVERIAKGLGCPPRSVGYAGLKDARAVTEQTMSVDGFEPEDVLSLRLEAIEFLWAERHVNKLRIGHLRGNRFTLRVRGIPFGRMGDVERTLAALRRRGLPNRYGPQRFGRAAQGGELGRLLIAGEWRSFLDAYVHQPFPRGMPGVLETVRRLWAREEWAACAERADAVHRQLRGVLRAMAASGGDTEQAVRAVPRRFLQLYVSAYQSLAFNAVLDARGDAFDELLDGDLAWRHANGSVFLVEDLRREAGRLSDRRISPSGPVPGWRMTRPAGEARKVEDRALEEAGVELASFRGTGMGLDQKGARRPLRVPVEDLRHRYDEGVLTLTFELPKGSYATCVLDEFLKDPDLR